jgi:hypothetical protein
VWESIFRLLVVGTHIGEQQVDFSDTEASDRNIQPFCGQKFDQFIQFAG